jgi:hypothetical protein
VRVHLSVLVASTSTVPRPDPHAHGQARLRPLPRHGRSGDFYAAMTPGGAPLCIRKELTSGPAPKMVLKDGPGKEVGSFQLEGG